MGVKVLGALNAQTLVVYGDSTLANIDVLGDSTLKDTSVTTLHASGDSTLKDTSVTTLHASGDSTLKDTSVTTLHASGDSTLKDTSVTNLTVSNFMNVVGQVYLKENVCVGENIQINKNTNVSGGLTVGGKTVLGEAIAITAPNGDNTTQIATTEFVTRADNFLAPKASPTFTGTVYGISKSMVGLENVDNTSDANKPISNAAQDALNTEKTRALAAEKILNDQKLLFPSTLLYGGNAPASSPPPVMVNAYGTKGWYYTNNLTDTVNKKINWYMPTRGMKVRDIKGLYLDMFNGLNIDTFNMPFITVYTVKDGNDFGSWYKSKKGYTVLLETSAISSNTYYTPFMNVSGSCPQPVLKNGSVVATMIKNDDRDVSKGLFGLDETVLTISIGTSTNTLPNAVEFCISKFGIVTTNTTQELVFADAFLAPSESPVLTGVPTAPTASSGTNTTQISTTEFVTRAILAERNTSTNADNIITGLISTEQTRAQGAEGVITALVSAEATRANIAEGVVTALVSAEATRAQGAESTITGMVTTEQTRAQNAEALLAPLAGPAFSGVPTAPTAGSGVNTTQIATTEFVQNVINAFTTVSPGTITLLDTLSTALASDTGPGGVQNAILKVVTDEVTRAEGIETGLRTDLNAEVTRAGGIESGLRTDLNAEVTRAGGIESSLSGLITAEVTRAGLAESSLSGLITAEVTRAGLAESSLSGLIAAEVTRAGDVEAQKAPSANPIFTGDVTVSTLVVKAADNGGDYKFTTGMVGDSSYDEMTISKGTTKLMTVSADGVGGVGSDTVTFSAPVIMTSLLNLKDCRIQLGDSAFITSANLLTLLTKLDTETFKLITSV